MSIQGLAFFLSRDHLGIRRTIRRTSRALPISALGLLAVAGHVSAAQQDIKVCGAIDAPGSYALTQNLSATGDCIVVSADNVTLDLNGFSIIGSGSGAGIRTSGSIQGAIIRNGSVTGFQNGIAFSLANASTVENMIITGNSLFGVIMGFDASVDRTKAVGNGSDGIRVNDHSIVSNSVANDNGTGISADVGSLVVNNVAARNSQAGVAATGNSSTVTGNTVSANDGRGISSFRGNIIDNTANLNGDAGIFVFCPGNVVGNLSTGNDGDNIQFDLAGGTCTADDNHNNDTIPNL